MTLSRNAILRYAFVVRNGSSAVGVDAQALEYNGENPEIQARRSAAGSATSLPIHGFDCTCTHYGSDHANDRMVAHRSYRSVEVITRRSSPGVSVTLTPWYLATAAYGGLRSSS
jgi:hypothetical protein